MAEGFCGWSWPKQSAAAYGSGLGIDILYDVLCIVIDSSFCTMLLLYLPLLALDKQQLDSAMLAEEVMKSAGLDVLPY